MSPLRGKIALVTGASSGIGLAVASEFVTQGAQVVIASRDKRTGSLAEKHLSALGKGKAKFISADVTNAKDVERMLDLTLGEFGKLDFAVNNAGATGNMGTTAELSEADFDHFITSNLKSVWLSMKYELAVMASQGLGSIVNVSSVKGITGAQNYSLYSAAKHGVIGLTKSAALEYAPFGIRINAVCPIAIQTPLMNTVLKNLFEEDEPEKNIQRYGQLLPIQRAGRAEEVANAIVWLCSPAASFITGAAIPVDGGSLARGIP